MQENCIRRGILKKLKKVTNYFPLCYRDFTRYLQVLASQQKLYGIHISYQFLLAAFSWNLDQKHKTSMFFYFVYFPQGVEQFNEDVSIVTKRIELGHVCIRSRVQGMAEVAS
jgi:hypothetical protein